MTSKLTREQAQKIIDAADAVMSALAGTNDEVHKDDTDKMIGLWDDLNDRYAPPEVVRNLASMALAAMDSEPVAALKLPPKLSNDRESAHELNAGVDTWSRCIDEVAKINGEMIIAGRVDGLHPSTVKLVNDFATALAEKLRKAEQKYGYSNAWTNNGWMTECLADFHQHIAKGDPRDVAAYCAFMWYHGWKTEPVQPAPVVPEEITFEKIAEITASQGYEYSINECICAASWWNACRAAMLQAGDTVSGNSFSDLDLEGMSHGNNPQANAYRELLAYRRNSPVIPDGWIPVSERMPETGGNYWGWWSESKRQGPVWFIKSELQAQFQSHEITHWMPLPAAPQEVK